MNRHVRLAVIGIAAAVAGVLAAVAAGAAGRGGDTGIGACAVRTSGKIVARGAGGCARGEFAITISGDAFKKSRGGTLTINGTAFKRGAGKTITINGTPFKSGAGKTITINGTPFKSQKGGTLTINGVAFTPGSANTLTINGTAFAPGAAGQAGAIGPIGPAGPPGAGAARSGPPAEEPGPVDATLGAAAAVLASVPLTIGDGAPHRVLVAGGFDAACAAPCTSPAEPVFDVQRDAADPAFTRRLPQFSAGAITSMSGAFSEVVDAPASCAPCAFTLRLRAVGAGAGGASTIRATAIRLAIVDLGPAGAG